MSHGDTFLGCLRCNPHRIPSIDLLNQYYDNLSKKRPAFGQEGNVFPPTHCKGSQVFGRYGKFWWSATFFDFNPQWLIRVSKLEKMARGQQIWLHWWILRSNERLCNTLEQFCIVVDFIYWSWSLFLLYDWLFMFWGLHAFVILKMLIYHP